MMMEPAVKLISFKHLNTSLPDLRKTLEAPTVSLEQERGDVEVDIENVEEAEPECRICRSALDDSAMQPCLCKGTMGLVHKGCIEKWLNESGKEQCGACAYKYRRILEHRYDWPLESGLEWLKALKPVDRVMFVFCATVTFLVATLTMVFLMSFIALIVDPSLDFDGVLKLWVAVTSRNYELAAGVLNRGGVNLNSIFRLVLLAVCLVISGTGLQVMLRVYWASWKEWSKVKTWKVQVLPMEPIYES